MRRLRLSSLASDDPLDGMANLFDLGVVFALGFGIAVMAQVSRNSPAAAAQALKGQQAEKVPDNTAPLERFRSTDETLGGNGTRLGTAYKLANGDIVYVPEAAAAANAQQPGPASPK